MSNEFNFMSSSFLDTLKDGDSPNANGGSAESMSFADDLKNQTAAEHDPSAESRNTSSQQQASSNPFYSPSKISNSQQSPSNDDDFSSQVKSPEFQQQLRDLRDDEENGKENDGSRKSNESSPPAEESSFSSLIGLANGEQQPQQHSNQSPHQAFNPQHSHSTSSQPLQQKPQQQAPQQEHPNQYAQYAQQHISQPSHNHQTGSVNASPHNLQHQQYVPQSSHPTIVPPNTSSRSTPHSRTSSTGSGFNGYRNASSHDSSVSAGASPPSNFTSPHYQQAPSNVTPNSYQNVPPHQQSGIIPSHPPQQKRQFFSPSSVASRNSTHSNFPNSQQPNVTPSDSFSTQSAPTPSFTPIGNEMPQQTYHTPQNFQQTQEQHSRQASQQQQFFSPSHPSLSVSPPQQQNSHFQPTSYSTPTHLEHTFSPGHALHPRQQSSEFSFDITGLSQNTMDEKLHNLSKMEARPIVSCGFGGKLVIMFPKRATRLNVMDKTPETILPFSQNGDVRIYSLSNLLGNTDYGRALNQYPGILLNTQKDTIISYINQIIMQYDRNVSVMGKSLTSEQLVEKQLWELLRLFVNIDRLTEDAVEDTLDNVKKVLLSHKNEIEQWNSGGFVSNGANNNTGSTQTGANFPESMNLNMNAPHVDLSHQQTYLTQMQKHLIDGHIEQACDIACTGHLWGHALLLASMIDKPTYTKVVTQFASNAFCHGSPLKTLYMMFADRGDLLFQPESQQLTDQFGNRFASGSHQQQQQHQQEVDKLCKNWQENLAVIVANRTLSSGEVIEKLGDALWREHGMVQSAHFCYLVGEFCTNFSNINNRVVLIGADHRKRGAGTKPFATVSSIQRTEIYHYFKRKHNAQHASPSFMVFRLVYAFWLAEIGHVALADSYVQDLFGQVEQLKNTVSFNHTFLRQINMLHDRIKGAGGARRDSVSSGKSFFSSIFSRVDSTINNMMSSEGESPTKPIPSDRSPVGVNNVESTPPPKKQNQNQNNSAAPASRSESNKEKSGGWLGWFSGKKKKKKGANLGSANTRKWSDKLQRYIPRDADEDAYVEQRFDAPPPSMPGVHGDAPPMMGDPGDSSRGGGAPPSSSSAAPVFNSMTSRRYASYSSFAPQGIGAVPSQPYRPSAAQMFMPQPMSGGQQPQQMNASPAGNEQSTASPNQGSVDHGSGSIPLNAPATFVPTQLSSTGGGFFNPNGGSQPSQQDDGSQQMQPLERQAWEDNGAPTYSGWSEPSWGEGELKISGGWTEESENGQQ